MNIFYEMIPWLFSGLGLAAITFLFSCLRNSLIRRSWNGVTITPLPEKSNIPEIGQKEPTQFFLGLRLTNEKDLPLSFEAIQTCSSSAFEKIQITTSIYDINGAALSLPILIQSHSTYDIILSMRIWDNSVSTYQFTINIFSLSSRIPAKFKFEVYRDIGEKQVYTNWRNKECVFGTTSIKAGASSAKVDFRKKLKRTPLVVNTSVIKSEKNN